ncbi:MAG: hypothetical protein U0271_47265 [Polyangiaceae bacterium]
MAASQSLSVTTHRRVVLVEFQRAIHGPPDRRYPDIDARGTGPELASVVGMTEGDTVELLLKRLHIDVGAELSVVSSDESIVEVVAPKKPHTLDAKVEQNLQIKGVAGGGQEPKKARLLVRYHSSKDKFVVIHELEIWVFQLAKISVVVYPVKLTGNAGATESAAMSDALRDQIFEPINHIWRACGIEFAAKVAKELSHKPPYRKPAIGNDDRNKLVALQYDDAAVNVYLIPRFIKSGLYGQGIGKHKTKDEGLDKPAVFQAVTIESVDELADPDKPEKGGRVERVPTHRIAHSLAHELGHYLGLSHTYDQPDQQFVFARRNLMFNYVNLPTDPAWRADMGYGAGEVGNLVALKNIVSKTSRGLLARATIFKNNQYAGTGT